MAYIGKQPLVGNYISCDSLSAGATTTYNLVSSGTAVFPTVPQNCIVSLNGVVQAPVTSFTISGSAIVFSTSLSTTDSIDYITVLGNTLNIGTPSNNTVGLSQFSATGTPSATTFLRGDNAWASATDLIWQSVQTTSFTATAGRAYPINTTSAGITVTLPASPATGNQVQIVDYAGTADTNAITINPNSNKLESGTANLLLTGDREGVILTYIDATQGWLATSGINEGTDALSPVPYSIDFLVIGGGGSSSSGSNGEGSGGGGAGGFRTSTQSVLSGTVITVTVGDGGTGTTYNNLVAGNNGSSSSISGSGLTTITSAGGGGGGKGTSSAPPAQQGLAGGSGGGNGSYNSGSGGAGNTPSTSPSQGNNGGAGDSGSPYYLGGGGGGAGAVGASASSNQAGAGGNGTASSITGSSVTRAGGGGAGGGSYPSGLAGAGGTGGGGNGGQNAAGTAGTANTGGGGGGSSAQGNGQNGGKGVVILSVPTASYSGTSSGSPTITTSGANTILQFNGDGSYTG